MTGADTVAIPKGKLEELEKEHDFLMQIREASEALREAERDYAYAKGESLEKKKVVDRLVADLNNLIEDGPPKPDPQGKLPFAMDKPGEDADYGENEFSDDDAEGGDEDDEPKVEAKAEPAKPRPVRIPADVDKLDLTDDKKRALAEAGVKTTADLIALGNRNWKSHPKGFSSLKGFGPKVVAALAAQLPSTAAEESKGTAAKMPPGRKAKIRILGFTAGTNRNLEAGDEYDVTIRDDETAILSFPGDEKFEFQPYEYEEIS